MRTLKFTAGAVIPVAKQVIPFREKVAVRFPELGAIFNPEFPETRNKVYVSNFFNELKVISTKKQNNFTYIGKSISTFRATVFIQQVGTYYSVWKHEECTALLEYEVTRVGENLEITGKVYSCFYGS